jgi:pyrroloquinoline quinone biosynthesis protein B
MQVMLLGTAAGGGFPQWNCWCPVCLAARAKPPRALPRTQSSVAISADGARWFLVNASPDVREQLSRLPLPPPDHGADSSGGVRRVPIEGLILTDAELDHSLGVALLREARRLNLYATRAVSRTLDRDARILPVTRAFADVRVTELSLYRPVPLRDSNAEECGLSVEAFAVPGDPPRFASEALPGHTVGLVIRDAAGATCVYVPACAALDDSLLRRFSAASLVLFDGTFWSSDELIALGISDRRAEDMGHVPIGGGGEDAARGGSLERLAACGTAVIYTHINNTNPVLIENSPQRAAVERAGVAVGFDGMRITVSPRPVAPEQDQASARHALTDVVS